MRVAWLIRFQRRSIDIELYINGWLIRSIDIGLDIIGWLNEDVWIERSCPTDTVDCVLIV